MGYVKLGVIHAVLACFLLVPANGQAAPIEDQSNLLTNSSFLITDELNHAQTFTVGLAGQLTRIDVGLNPSSGILSVDLTDTIAGEPGSTVLASDTFSAGFSTGPGLYSFDFTPFNVMVNVGDVLAFSLAGDPGSAFGVFAFDGDAYPGGLDFNRVNSVGPSWVDFSSSQVDLRFRTWVDPDASPTAVPLPAALPLLAGGLGLMGFMGWRRKRKAAAA